MRAAFSIVFCLLVGISTQAHADGAPASLQHRLDRVVKEANLGTAIGVHAVQVSNAKVLYGKNADIARNPASNTKLLTSAAALRAMGSWYRFRTTLHGQIEDSQVDELVIVGRGDPTLGRAQLLEIAFRLKALGVRSVGAIVVDARYFDDEILPPAFEQQPNETAAFRSPVAAFAVNRASYKVQLDPLAIGKAPTITVDVPSYVKVDNKARTVPGRHSDLAITQRPLGKNRMTMIVTGTVAIDEPTREFPQRVIDPLAHAGHALSEALHSLGIQGKHCLRFELSKATVLPTLLDHFSVSLGDIVKRLGKRSDNFTAEMLLKVLGAEVRQPGTSATGIERVRTELSHLGVRQKGMALVNGSGLFSGNAMTPRSITSLLMAMAKDRRVGPDFVAHLAISRADGTLRTRKRLPKYIVRAKTGTLADVVALSGYILKKNPSRRIAFSVLINDVQGKIGKARKLADQIANELAR